MIYFSELKGKKVFTEDEVEIGRLNDLIFLASETPKVTKLRIKNRLNQSLNIPISYLKKINNKIILRKSYIDMPLEENELYAQKNILDKQIIDLKGNKVVRVNDIAFQEKGAGGEIEEAFYLAGVDVGILGILRWFGLDDKVIKLLRIFNLKIYPNFLSWADIQPLELARGKVHLKQISDKLKKIRPEDLADYLEKTNILNIQNILKVIDNKQAIEVVQNLNLNFQTQILTHLKPEKAVTFISLMDPNDAVDVLLMISQKKRNQILEYADIQKKNQLERLIHYSGSPAGDLIALDYITVKSSATVTEVINNIKKETGDLNSLIAIYVVNEQEQLTGVFNLHELLLQQDPQTPVYRFMINKVIVGHMTTPVEIILEKMIKYSLTTMPIINKNKNILGIINLLDVAEHIIKRKK